MALLNRLSDGRPASTTREAPSGHAPAPTYETFRGFQFANGDENTRDAAKQPRSRSRRGAHTDFPQGPLPVMPDDGGYQGEAGGASQRRPLAARLGSPPLSVPHKPFEPATRKPTNSPPRKKPASGKIGSKNTPVGKAEVVKPGSQPGPSKRPQAKRVPSNQVPYHERVAQKSLLDRVAPEEPTSPSTSTSSGSTFVRDISIAPITSGSGGGKPASKKKAQAQRSQTQIHPVALPSQPLARSEALLHTPAAVPSPLLLASEESPFQPTVADTRIASPPASAMVNVSSDHTHNMDDVTPDQYPSPESPQALTPIDSLPNPLAVVANAPMDVVDITTPNVVGVQVNGNALLSNSGHPSPVSTTLAELDTAALNVDASVFAHPAETSASVASVARCSYTPLYPIFEGHQAEWEKVRELRDARTTFCRLQTTLDRAQDAVQAATARFLEEIAQLRAVADEAKEDFKQQYQTFFTLLKKNYGDEDVAQPRHGFQLEPGPSSASGHRLATSTARHRSSISSDPVTVTNGLVIRRMPRSPSRGAAIVRKLSPKAPHDNDVPMDNQEEGDLGYPSPAHDASPSTPHDDHAVKKTPSQDETSPDEEMASSASPQDFDTPALVQDTSILSKERIITTGVGTDQDEPNFGQSNNVGSDKQDQPSPDHVAAQAKEDQERIELEAREAERTQELYRQKRAQVLKEKHRNVLAEAARLKQRNASTPVESTLRAASQATQPLPHTPPSRAVLQTEPAVRITLPGDTMAALSRSPQREPHQRLPNLSSDAAGTDDHAAPRDDGVSVKVESTHIPLPSGTPDAPPYNMRRKRDAEHIERPLDGASSKDDPVHLPVKKARTDQRPTFKSEDSFGIAPRVEAALSPQIPAQHPETPPRHEHRQDNLSQRSETHPISPGAEFAAAGRGIEPYPRPDRRGEDAASAYDDRWRPSVTPLSMDAPPYDPRTPSQDPSYRVSYSPDRRGRSPSMARRSYSRDSYRSPPSRRISPRWRHDQEQSYALPQRRSPDRHAPAHRPHSRERFGGSPPYERIENNYRPPSPSPRRHRRSLSPPPRRDGGSGPAYHYSRPRRTPTPPYARRAGAYEEFPAYPREYDLRDRRMRYQDTPQPALTIAGPSRPRYSASQVLPDHRHAEMYRQPEAGGRDYPPNLPPQPRYAGYNELHDSPQPAVRGRGRGRGRGQVRGRGGGGSRGAFAERLS